MSIVDQILILFNQKILKNLKNSSQKKNFNKIYKNNNNKNKNPENINQKIIKTKVSNNQILKFPKVKDLPVLKEFKYINQIKKIQGKNIIIIKIKKKNNFNNNNSFKIQMNL